MEKERRDLGPCCSCGEPCYTDQRLTIGDPDCVLRHSACPAPPRRSTRVRESPDGTPIAG